MSNERVWEIEVSILMPTYLLEVEAATEVDAIERALSVLNEAGDIPEHGECDVQIHLISPRSGREKVRKETG